MRLKEYSPGVVSTTVGNDTISIRLFRIRDPDQTIALVSNPGLLELVDIGESPLPVGTILPIPHRTIISGRYLRLVRDSKSVQWVVGDVVKETSYKVFFISENNEKISNECIYVADKKDIVPRKRIFRLRFNFKNKQYDKSKRYYLVAYDEKNGLEVLRHCVVMDIAFADDFGFSL